MNELQEIILLELLTNHVGQDNAVKREICGVSGAKLRTCINSLRVLGYPICSDGMGYYIAGDLKELRVTIGQLLGRIDAISRAVSGLFDSRALISLAGITPAEYTEGRLFCDLMCEDVEHD